MSAVSDQFLDVGFDGAEADEPAETPAKDEEGTGSTAKAAETKTTESAETKGDTSKEAAPPAANADEDDLEVDEQRRVPLKTALSERKKRQDVERQLSEARGELNALRSGNGRPQQQQTNESSAEQRREAQDQQFWQGSPSEFIQSEIKKAVDDNRYAASWDDAVEKHGAEKAQQYADAFAKRVADERKRYNGVSPLAIEMQNHRRPSLFATDSGRTILETDGIGSPDEFRKKLRAEVRAEVEEELKRSNALAMASNIPQSNVTAKGSSATAEVDPDEIDEPEDMKKILPRKRK